VTNSVRGKEYAHSSTWHCFDYVILLERWGTEWPTVSYERLLQEMETRCRCNVVLGSFTESCV
jgi:hypothetical protein